MKINTRRVGSFLKSITEAEKHYMRRCMEISDHINRLMKDEGVTKDRVKSHFYLAGKDVDDFICGNFNYSMADMAHLNSLYMEVETEKLKDKAPIKVGSEIME